MGAGGMLLWSDPAYGTSGSGPFVAASGRKASFGGEGGSLSDILFILVTDPSKELKQMFTTRVEQLPSPAAAHKGMQSRRAPQLGC